MAGIATPQETHVDHDGRFVCLHIQGAGTLRMPQDAAHQLARDLVRECNKLTNVRAPRPWQRPK